MRPLAEWKFKEDNGFAFQKDVSKYSDKDIPDAKQPREIYLIDQLCSIEAGSKVDEYIENTFFR